MAPTLPDVSSRYGAPFGRVEHKPAPDTPRKFYLRRIRINSGGYDSGGAYWGLGAPLYWATDDNGAELFFRARNRDAARAHVASQYPQTKFYR